MKKKLLCVSLLLCGIITSCDREDVNGEVINKDMTQLSVYNFDGGVGTEWLYTFKKNFEAKYAETSFEEGKKGVQILINPYKVNGEGMISTFGGSSYDVMFNEYVRYNDYVSQGLFLDITDLVKETCENETRTIEDKLSEDSKEALLAFDGKYYALPHYEVYQGLIYDIDLFDSKRFYFSDDLENGNDGFIITKNEKKSCGPDGIYNTYDDGLPSSYEEFFKLCDYIVLKGCTPFVWTGEYDDYPEYLLNALYANYEGKEDAMLNYTLNSQNETTEVITGFSETNNPIVENVSITERNAYLLKQQSGRYYALKFLERILSDSAYYHPFSMNNDTFSHTDAQEEFIFSSLENNPIAMLIDGTWWENEANDSGAIARSINTYSDRAKNRNYGFMPLPKKVTGRVNENEGSRVVVTDYISSFCGINANIKNERKELAKLFVQYCYTDESLQAFTVETGISKGVEYELGANDLAKMTKFTQNVWELRKNADVVYPHSSNNLFINNENALTSNIWQTTIDKQPYAYVFNALKNKKTAEDAFLGTAITKATWEKNYGKFF